MITNESVIRIAAPHFLNAARRIVRSISAHDVVPVAVELFLGANAVRNEFPVKRVDVETIFDEIYRTEGKVE